MRERPQSNGPLHDRHAHMLRDESGIAPDIIQARGYRTVTVQAELRRLGFGERQCLVPALLLPVWSPAGEIALYQSRPDTPRIVNGKAIKYETPSGALMAMDVHPSVRHLLGDLRVPLFITEGIKKGDALASRGVCALALLGVWNWRGTNEAGGATALADWEYVALRGRQAVIVFDSDVMLKRGVHEALTRLSGFLQHRGARVLYIYLPAGSHAEKVGVDDFLAGGRTVADLLALATEELREPARGNLGDEGADPSLGEANHQRSQATHLVELAAQADLFHSPLGDAFACVEVDGHRETWNVRSSGYRRWLVRAFYLDERKAPGGSALSDALTLIEAKAQFEGEQRPVWTRVAQGPDDSIYLSEWPEVL